MSRKVINIVKKNKINQFNLSLNMDSAIEISGNLFCDIEEIENFDPTADINIATITMSAEGETTEETFSLIKISEVSDEERTSVVYSGAYQDSISISCFSIAAVYPKQKPDEVSIRSAAISNIYVA